MTTTMLGDDLVLEGPNGTDFRVRVNAANGELDLIYSDPTSGVGWVADTIIYQATVAGMEHSRSMRVDWFSLDSENPFEAGGALDTATFGLSRHVPGRTPLPYDALWAIVAVGDDNKGGVKNQQYGAITFRILDPTPDANGHAQGETRISGNGFDKQGLMGIAKGAVLTDQNLACPVGGYLGFGTWNVPGGYFVNGNRVDRQTVNLGSADLVQPGETRFYGPGYSASYATGAYFLTTRVGYLRNFTIRLPDLAGSGTATAVLQRQYTDAGIQISLTGNAQQGSSAGGLLFGAGEAIGVKLVLGPGCNPQGGFACAFDYGA